VAFVILPFRPLAARRVCSRASRTYHMNISRAEQRVLHVLALGGEIRHFRDDKGRIADALCHTREGLVLSDLTLPLFQRLRRRRLIASKDVGPYRISLLGRRSVRAQLDNRG
jgi:uncharacterized protein YjhX (UPF0386 family)